jgi:hypothetical protein
MPIENNCPCGQERTFFGLNCHDCLVEFVNNNTLLHVPVIDPTTYCECGQGKHDENSHCNNCIDVFKNNNPINVTDYPVTYCPCGQEKTFANSHCDNCNQQRFCYIYIGDSEIATCNTYLGTDFDNSYFVNLGRDYPTVFRDGQEFYEIICLMMSFSLNSVPETLEILERLPYILNRVDEIDSMKKSSPELSLEEAIRTMVIED